MKIVSIVGTRPQLIKAAALQPALRARHDEVFIDTGQHWDESMAGSFFDELGLEQPDHSLGAGGGTHAEQTAAMLLRLEPILTAERPEAVLVYGDTNSTLAGALCAAKLGIPVAHVEAGLRSFDRRMPEELNRVVADHLASWSFAPTPTAVANLRAEGVVDGVVMVGDLMQDLAARVSPEVRDPTVLEPIATRLGLKFSPGRYCFATVHRQENREPAAMAAWAGILANAATPDRPVVLALHPGTRRAMEQAGISCGPDVRIIEPQGYRTSLALQLHAAAVITDSGGVFSGSRPGSGFPASCSARPRNGTRRSRDPKGAWSSWVLMRLVLETSWSSWRHSTTHRRKPSAVPAPSTCVLPGQPTRSLPR